MAEDEFSIKDRMMLIETAVRTIAEWLDGEHRDFHGETITRILDDGEGSMADPKLQIEQKVEELEKTVERQNRAIGTMAQWLVQAQTGFGAHDAEGIEKILRGEEGEESRGDVGPGG